MEGERGGRRQAEQAQTQEGQKPSPRGEKEKPPAIQGQAKEAMELSTLLLSLQLALPPPSSSAVLVLHGLPDGVEAAQAPPRPLRRG